jgi:hypothetical protein
LAQIVLENVFLALFMFAYIDPGTGSILLQMLIAGGIGAIAFFRKRFVRLLRFFASNKSDPSSGKPPGPS